MRELRLRLALFLLRKEVQDMADVYKRQVSVNTAPTITSSMANGSNLGTKTAGFNFQYTVNDVDGDTVTVKEYLDNVLKRTYTATLGQVNTFQAVTAANWQKILNGSHTLKVVASDGKADSAAYTVTFAKKVTKATVTLAAVSYTHLHQAGGQCFGGGCCE